MSAKITSYKTKSGKEYPVIQLSARAWANGKLRFYYFGLAKCKAILENLEAVKSFAGKS